jgi:hypothetical protein
MKLPSVSVVPMRGSGPDGRIQPSDIRGKLRQIRGDLDEATAPARSYAPVAGLGAVVLLIIVAFILGRQRGRAKSTWVDVQRL